MRILIIRLGAIGDTIITTPLVRYLKQGGHEIYYLGSETAQTILQNNPHVDKFILHVRDSVPNDKLGDYFESVREAHECDKLIDLCESIEVNLALYPNDPRSKYPKYERMEMCNKNYYEETFRITEKQLQLQFPCYADHDVPAEVKEYYNPEIFFTSEEESEMEKFFKELTGRFVILWGLSGSSRNKTYPYSDKVIKRLIKDHGDVSVITVGDEACQILEYPICDIKRVICKSGQWSIRQSILACKYASLVVSPDTGLLHGSGAYPTPKIGLFTATTRENVTKHFLNDYSLEPEGIDCAPCFLLIYKANVQSNMAEDGITPLCCAYGIPPQKLIERIEVVYDKRKLQTANA